MLTKKIWIGMTANCIRMVSIRAEMDGGVANKNEKTVKAKLEMVKVV